MSSESLFAFCIAVLIFSFKIGPNITAAMSYSMASGVKGLLAHMLGFYLSLPIYLAIVFVGLETLNIDIVFFGILAKSMGAAILIYMGIKGFKGEDVGTPLGENDPQSFVERVTATFILTLSNPMVIVFYATIIPVFVPPETLTIPFMIFLSVLILLLDSIGSIVYCAPIILFRQKLPKTFGRYMRVTSSIIMISIGLYIGYSAIGAIDVLRIEG